MNKEIHVVSFDVPFPPDYGGVMDVFYRIKALAELDCKIHLHCFQYGRKESDTLNSLCASVSYYQRRRDISFLFDRAPYIVASRRNATLQKKLLADDFPVILEGLHCAAFLPALNKAGKKTLLRAHNIEHNYYRDLATDESGFLKRLYYYRESAKLKAWEPVLKLASSIAAINFDECEYFKASFGDKVFYLPAFHPFETVQSLNGIGNYLLFHGNLSVNENIRAALWLIRIFGNSALPLYIAGKKPDKKLIESASATTNVKLIPDPGEIEMKNLIMEAQIHLLPAFHTNGMRLKLLSSLYAGRHVIASGKMLAGSNLESLCHIASSDLEFYKTAEKLFDVEFTDTHSREREHLLQNQFNNTDNAKVLLSKIFN